ncbi:MAG: hypothetical protein ACYSWO_20325 [Planctomycetota bacterium]
MDRRRYILVLVLICVFLPSAQADWINLSGAENAPNIAEIYIDKEHVRVVLEVFVGDVSEFTELLPDDFLRNGNTDRPALAERLRCFSEETLQFITDDGTHLQAELKLVEPRMRKERPSPFAGMINPMTRRPVPGPPADKRVLYAEIVYPFGREPKELTVIPPLDKNGMASVSIGFTAYHEAAPIVDFKYLSGPSKVKLDWEDPWYSAFEDKALKRWQQSGVQSFLYVEPYEVRHEILIRVKDLAQWLDLGLRGSEFIEIDEFDPLKQRTGEFFLNRDKVLIDGRQGRPILDRTSYVKYSTAQSQFVDVPERLPLTTAMIGVIVTYITDGIPQEVSVEWDLFSDRTQKVPTNAIDPAGPFPSYITPDDNVHVWKNYLKSYTIPTVESVAATELTASFDVPFGGALCLGVLMLVAWQYQRRRGKSARGHLYAGSGMLLFACILLLFPHLVPQFRESIVGRAKMTDEQAAVVLRSLLKNVYRAFDFREESDVYDKLAVSVSGDLLSDIYLQNRKSFAVQRAGGAQAKVKEIEILDVEINDSARHSGTLPLRSSWTAFGTVGHWGHIHSRMNLYDALVTVGVVDGAWKIVALELLEEKRVQPLAQTLPSGRKAG